jgi:hypothetical protein
MGRFFKDYSDFIAEHFSCKMQKLTVDAGFSCPNRDGTIGRGGCVYCNNSSFSPALGAGAVAEQLLNGKKFFERKYPSMRYLAYFQSYTNTHGNRHRLMELYNEALAVDKVDGLIIGTRPDCVDEQLLLELANLDAWVMMEYGAESSHNATLQAINRCHTWQQTVKAVELTAQRGIAVGLHLIMGLPGETRAMMMETIERVARLPLQTVKLHQLQVIRGTTLQRELTGDFNDDTLMFRGLPVHMFAADEYADFCVEVVERLTALNPSIAIERFTSQAPANMLIYPRWGLKNYQFTNLLNNRLAARLSR